ncbi:MAG: hypothetical protein HY432_01820 [Candidatus Liptonbacteria bacterium]|nr:hypothetical protein [Candidatus Liptonbacteria bacterium]
MIIFLYGPDEYRRLQKKNEIIAEFRKKHAGMGLDYFDAAGKDSFARFREFAANQSLFDPKKLAVLENVFESSEKELTAVLKDAAKDKNLSVLISEKNKSSENISFLSRKSTSIKSQKFEYLGGAEWAKFINDLAKENGLSIEPLAIKFLSAAYQNDTWRLVTEVQKLATLRSPELVEGPKKNIGTKDLEALGLEIGEDFFGVLRNLKNYGLEGRMASLEKLFSMNEPMPKIFNVLAYQLPDKLPQLAKYDILVKSGKLDYEEVLVDLVI